MQQVIGKIAEIELPVKQWENLISDLLTNMNNPQVG